MTDITAEPSALETLCDDIARLDPWHRFGDDALIAFCPAEDESQPYFISFFADSDGKELAIHPGLNGLRLYMEMHQHDILSEQISHETDALILSWDSDGLHMEKCLPGLVPDQPQGQDLVLMERLLTVLRKLCRSGNNLALPFDWSDDSIQAPTWRIHLQDSEYLGLRSYHPYENLADPPPLTDEFTLARLAKLPVGHASYEIFHWYLLGDPSILPMDPGTPLPMVVFLVNLDTGLIEGNELMLAGPDWHKKAIRKIYDIFFEKGTRPQQLFVASFETYRHYHREWNQAKIAGNCPGESYVAESLLEEFDFFQPT